MGRDVGGEFRIGNSCTLVADSGQCMAKPIQYCKVRKINDPIKKMSHHSSAIFWKSLSRIGVSSSLNFWQNSAVKLSGPGAFVCWKISDYTFNFHACHGSVKIFYFFLVEFWKVTLF